MPDLRDLTLTLRSHYPLVVLETSEELRALDLLASAALENHLPLFRWSITEGLTSHPWRLDEASSAAPPTEVLQLIKSHRGPGVFALLDFHHFLEDPMHVRLLKEIAQQQRERPHVFVVFISHNLPLPRELRGFAVEHELSIPNRDTLEALVTSLADEYFTQRKTPVRTNRHSFDLLVRNLLGLTRDDALRLARGAIFDDGVITEADARAVMQAKYALLNKDEMVSFECDTASLADVAGLDRLKEWLRIRRRAFLDEPSPLTPDSPKGLLLLGVQGCGKSLAAKGVAGCWGVPLLRLDVGTLYNKYIGETEKNLRRALQLAAALSPCVLWIDEIEKSIATGENDGGVSRRVLGSLLTWMEEKTERVFVVATANDIQRLPPELIRKGRFDEIFFVDLPDVSTRRVIFAIHLRRRGFKPERFDLIRMAALSEGFSGSEIEQIVVSAFHSSRAEKEALENGHLEREIQATRPLSCTMAEQIEALRQWAMGRTVPAG